MSRKLIDSISLPLELNFEGRYTYKFIDMFGDFNKVEFFTDLKYDSVINILKKYLNLEDENTVYNIYNQYGVKDFAKNISNTYSSESYLFKKEKFGLIFDKIEPVKEEDYKMSQLKIFLAPDMTIETNDLIKKIVDDIIEFGQYTVLNDVFYTIGIDQYGYVLNTNEITNTVMDIELHYGKEFVKEYESILKNLTDLSYGLVLLHGKPGTAKTYLIRHLISKLNTHKKIIYMPSYMIEQLSNPELITFLMEHKNSILVLEDAEFALQSRDNDIGAQAVSNLLNITCGLLNDAMNVQVIATFNMPRKDIDPALLRAGRLLNEWYFDELCVEDANKLAKSLGKPGRYKTSKTVAEIYEGTENKKTIQETKRKIGFNE